VFTRNSENVIVSGMYGGIRAFEIVDGANFSGKQRFAIEDKNDEDRVLAISADGKTFANGGGGPTIELREAATGKLTRALASYEVKRVRSLAFSPTERCWR
jgi:hypothetical protein